MCSFLQWHSHKRNLVCLRSLVSLALIQSKLVLASIDALEKVAENNEVKLFWVPGHSGVPGNEEADRLANEGSGRLIAGPEPLVGIPIGRIRRSIQQWMEGEHQKIWGSLGGLRHSRLFLPGPSSHLTKKLRNLSRVLLKGVVDWVTGHCRLRKHLTRMGIENDPLCRWCAEEDETPEHLLYCPALGWQRIRCFGTPVVSPQESLVSVKDLLAFIRRTEGLLE